MSARVVPAAEREVPADVERLARDCGTYGDTWRMQCHRASLMIVQALGAGKLPEMQHLVKQHGTARVARGACSGVMGQHSWVVFGDPYDEHAMILDATLWSYDPHVPGVMFNHAGRRWRPKGAGLIWEAGRPPRTDETGEEAIPLTPRRPLSASARTFLDMCGPLGRRGWSTLANLPLGGWPASEIIAAMDDTRELSALVPIDVLGMVTDRNPEGLYLA